MTIPLQIIGTQIYSAYICAYLLRNHRPGVFPQTSLSLFLSQCLVPALHFIQWACDPSSMERMLAPRMTYRWSWTQVHPQTAPPFQAQNSTRNFSNVKTQQDENGVFPLSVCLLLSLSPKYMTHTWVTHCVAVKKKWSLVSYLDPDLSATANKRTSDKWTRPNVDLLLILCTPFSLSREGCKYCNAVTHRRVLKKVINEVINKHLITTMPLGSPTGFILPMKGFKVIKQNCAIAVV